MSSQSILSINMEEFNKQENFYNKIIESLLNEKMEIRFKNIKWSEDIIFNKNEILLDEFIKDDNKLKDHILLIGDYKDKIILNYDIINKTWNKMESTFGAEYEFLDYSCMIKYKHDLILITGGCVYSNYRNTASRNTYLAKVISKEQITFSEFKPMLMERFSHGNCIVKGVPYVFGGHNGVTTLNSMEYYDEKEGLWKTISTGMNMEREIFAHCVVKDRYIYVFGGFNDTHLDTIEKFDTLGANSNSHKWRLLNIKMKRPLQNATAVTISEDQIVLIGGYNGTMHKNIDILYLNSMCWTSVDKLKVPRRRSHCYKYENSVINIVNFRLLYSVEKVQM